MNMKKAQGATEYLIILAVVIIIALIVVAAMGGIPGIGTGATERASKSFWDTADVAIPSYAVGAAADDINITIRNNQRNAISALTVTINDVALTCDATSLSAGQTTDCGGDMTCAAAGDSYNYGVSITYTDSETDAAYTFTGEGHKLKGKCAK